MNSNGDFSFKTRIEKSDKKSHLSEATANADFNLKKRIDDLLNEGLVKEVIEEIRKTCNQSPNRMPVAKMFAIGMLTRFLFSCLVDADRLNSAEFNQPSIRKERLARRAYYDWNIALARFNKRINCLVSNQPIDQIRQSISDSCHQKASSPQGIFTLSVPTGGGKTLASLRFALEHAKHYELDRIIYVIPYTSIIEQNAEVARDFLEREDDLFPWVLEHHSNLVRENENWQTKLLSENWDAPVVFTTMVQFLDCLFAGGTRSVRRMHQLANSVLIFDEIQTLPIKCVHLFCNALNYFVQCANTSAILCTATQPLLGPRLPNPELGHLSLAHDYELIDGKEQLFDKLARVEIHNRCTHGGWSENEIVNLIRQRFEQFGSCLVIVNTKSWAKRLYQVLADIDEYGEVTFHLSTNQCVMHRKAVLRNIKSKLDNDEPVLCISTQLIEAGVDVDFASVIRFLAGLDSINQAAGRCNRNGRLRDANGNFVKGHVDIVKPAEESLRLLVEIHEGVRSTERVFREFGEQDLLTPRAMDAYFNYFFFKRKDQMNYPVDGPINLLDMLANNESNPRPKWISQRKKLPLLLQSFMAAGKQFKAIDAPTNAVIVPYGEGKNLINRLCGINTHFGMSDLLKEAQQFSVNLFWNEWKKLETVDAVKEVQEELGIYYLDSSHYSDAFGVSSENVEEYEFLSI